MLRKHEKHGNPSHNDIYVFFYVHIKYKYIYIYVYNDTVNERNPLDMETYPMSFSNAFPYRKLCRISSVSDPAMSYWIGIAWRWNQIVYDRNYWPPDKCNMGSPDKCNMVSLGFGLFSIYTCILIWKYDYIAKIPVLNLMGLGQPPNIGCWIYMILYASIICKHSAMWNSVWCDWKFKQRKNQGDA